MKNIYISIIVALAVSVNPCMAQKKRTKAKRQPVVQLSEEELLAKARLEQMISATQIITFIDSIVVNKNNFLDHIKLSKESGTLCKYNNMFGGTDKPEAFLHMNELGNKFYLSCKDNNGKINLFTCDRIGNEWAAPTALGVLGTEEEYENLNYPFIMADGTTLYFAATGSESIGGYDIFETRFDSESGKFLKPENIGMPFNSTANDYMYAIDEMENIGWFVTDRNQPEDKVCIYTFIPSETRLTYPTEKYGIEEIEKFARIESIAKTWGNGIERNKALARLTKLRDGNGKKKEHETEMKFDINDNTTYRNISDFKAEKNAGKFKQLQELRAILNTLSTKTDRMREQYAKGNAAERKKLAPEILKDEKETENIERQIKTLEKDIRNAENRLLNNSK